MLSVPQPLDYLWTLFLGKAEFTSPKSVTGSSFFTQVGPTVGRPKFFQTAWGVPTANLDVSLYGSAGQHSVLNEPSNLFAPFSLQALQSTESPLCVIKEVGGQTPSVGSP